MALPETRITKALIRLRGCAGWSVPVLFANPEDRFSRVEAQIIQAQCHPCSYFFLSFFSLVCLKLAYAKSTVHLCHWQTDTL